MHKICGQSLCIITHCAKCRISGCRPAKILCIFSLDKCCRLCYTETTRARTVRAPMCHDVRIPVPWYPYPYIHGTPYLLPTYIHACIDTFVYLIVFVLVFVFVCLIVFVSLTLLFLLTLSPLALSLPVVRPALGQGQQASSLLCAQVFYFI